MALFFEWALNGADSYHPLGVQPKLHRHHRSLSHARGDASIGTGLIHLVFHLVMVDAHPPGTRTYGPVLRRFYDVILAFLRPFAKAP